jgi:hypothetical protein
VAETHDFWLRGEIGEDVLKLLKEETGIVGRTKEIIGVA